MNRYEKNLGAGVRWFGGAESVSRAPITGLGADGNGSQYTFMLGRVMAPVYDWRNAAGNALMNSGFDNFKYLYNNPQVSAVDWDINQLRSEQKTLQPIHEQFLKNSDSFTWLSKTMTDSNGVGMILNDKQTVPGGVDILSYKSRINFGCKLLGYSASQGCRP